MKCHIRLIPIAMPTSNSNSADLLALSSLASVHTDSPDVRFQLVYMYGHFHDVKLEWHKLYILPSNGIWRINVQDS